MELKHLSFNTTMDYFGVETTLSRICAEQEKLGWRLVDIVHHHQYESIAVFERSNQITRED